MGRIRPVQRDLGVGGIRAPGNDNAVPRGADAAYGRQIPAAVGDRDTCNGTTPITDALRLDGMSSAGGQQSRLMSNSPSPFPRQRGVSQSRAEFLRQE